MSDDGTVEIVLGILFLVGGLATLAIESIPVICYGAIIFGPILMASGFMKAARAGRPRRVALPPRYYPPPQSTPARPEAPPATAPAGTTATPAARTCPKCGNTPPAEAHFCNRCGAVLPHP